MKAFLAFAGWCLVVYGALNVLSLLTVREINIARETETILAFGFGFIILGLSAVLAALTRDDARRSQLPPSSRDPSASESRAPRSADLVSGAGRDPTQLVWTGRNWKILRPFFGPKAPK